MRNCNACGVSSIVSAFPKRGNVCKNCVALYMRVYRQRNSTRIAKLKKAWKLANFAHACAKDRAYAQRYPERRALARKKWRSENPEADRMAKDKWARENVDMARALRARWDSENPGKRQSILARRRASKIQRTPKWLTKDDHWLMAQAYELAALRTKKFGFPWHVDHIIPLQGKNVSGLHVPANLRVIPGAENYRKSNKYVAA